MNLSRVMLAAMASAAMVACGGGGGGGPGPAAPVNLTPTVPDPIVTGGPSTAPSTTDNTGLRGLSDLAGLRYGYHWAQWLAVRLSTVYDDVNPTSFPVAGTGSAPCAGGGTVSHQWIDNDKDGTKSIRDQFVIGYQHCARSTSTLDGQATFTLLASNKYEIKSAWADGDNRVDAVLLGEHASPGNYSFSTGETGFSKTGGSLRYGGIDTDIQSFSVSTDLDTTKNDSTLEFNLFVLNKGSTAFVSGIEFRGTVNGPTGSNPTNGSMSVSSIFDPLRVVKLTVAPDPAYVLINIDPSVLVAGDQTETQMTWTDFNAQ